MTKNVTICFRTNNELQKALENISEHERRSVSSVIENILYTHLKGREALKKVKPERRQFARKTVDASALISGLTPDGKDLSTGAVVNISLGGLQVSIPSSHQYEIKEDTENPRISVVFALPQSKRPLTVQCVPQHVHVVNGETNIGASFCDSIFRSYQAIQRCLIN